ncbi:MAG: response regulator [Acidobacteriota bacterium]|nr:response regulator [Acidobacteriota bacterium]MDQ7087308.1 response regulator [Acidobacteriota bacterium]
MEGHTRSPWRLLIVDDDEGVREGLAKALARHGGYEVATAADGFEAGYRFAAIRPHLVILDIVMPGMGGFDVCQRLRELAGEGEIKIIVLTGYPGNSSGERSLVSGADLFLTKPQDIHSLVMHIDDLLGE